MKLYRIIDKQGYFIRDDFTFDEEQEIGLDVEPSQGLYQPKWDGEKWIEGATQEYIDSLKPTIEEVPLDVRVAKVEQEQEQIVDVLAEILGGMK